MHDVAIGDDVLGAFEAHLTGILGTLLAATGDKIVIRDRFGADEALFEIAMDDTRGLRRLHAVRYGPGARLLGADSEERHQIEELVAGAYDAHEAGLVEAER